jgi:DNA-binding MarR family transcriptional regulator
MTPNQPPMPARTGGVAFLLAQLGATASEQFAQALAEHGLTPALVGVLRVLQFEPGISQQALAERLGLVPSRVVAFVDELEGRGWIARARDKVDRRVNVLTVTKAGGEAFKVIASIARTHERRTTAGLEGHERAVLLGLLGKLAGLRALTPGVHPGYRNLN